ncbi:MAG: Gfo/Idh/MocA family oxidoreductase [Patescibacteria group bacterium]
MLTLGCIGAGFWGKNLIRNFDGLPDVNLKWVSDLNDDNLKKIAANFPKVKTTKNVNDIFNDKEVDAVVIATQSPTHYEIAKGALNKGKHVFVEKPLTLKVEHAEELIELADKKNVKLMVGHLLEYHPCVQYLKDKIRNGEFGKIYYMYTQRVNLGIFRKNENALWSLAPHDISVILYLFGDLPNSVSARGQNYLPTNVEDVSFVNFYFKDNKMASIHASWLDPHKIRQITLVGEKQMAVFDDVATSDKVKVFTKTVVSSDFEDYKDFLTINWGDTIIPHIENQEPLSIECQHFVDSIQNDTRPRSDGEDGLRVVKLLNLAQQSMDKNGKPFDL